MDKLTPRELNTLYGNFVEYRDCYCKGWAKMSIKEFYNKYKLSKYEHPHDAFDKTMKTDDYPYGTFGGY